MQEHAENCGCDVASCCFQCVLAKCKWDGDDGHAAYQQWKHGAAKAAARADAVRIIAAGTPSKEAAAELGVAVRTFYRKRHDLKQATPSVSPQEAQDGLRPPSSAVQAPSAR